MAIPPPIWELLSKAVTTVNKDPRDILIRPVVSEKSYAGYDNNVYTFIVAHDANKIEIRKAVEVLFGKKVEKVHTINRKGKRTRNRHTRSKPRESKRHGSWQRIRDRPRGSRPRRVR